MKLGILVIPSLNRPLMFPWNSHLEMLPYGGRFRAVDFWLASMSSAGIKHFLVVEDSPNSELRSYLVDRFLDYEFLFIGMKTAESEVEEIKDVLAGVEVESVLIGVFCGVFWADLSDLPDGKFAVVKGVVKDTKAVVRIQGKHLWKALDCIVKGKAVESGGLSDMFLKDLKTKPFEVEPLIFDLLVSVEQYFQWHIKLAKGEYLKYDDKFSLVPVPSVSHHEYGIIAKKGRVVRSLIAEGTRIEGEVIDSVVMPGVKISRKSRVENSIIMPGVWIGKDVQITNSIVGEVKFAPEKPTIHSGCRIGKSIGDGKPNVERPDVVSSGITLISNDIEIPRGLLIGTNCIVLSKDTSLLKSKKVIPDGSLVK